MLININNNNNNNNIDFIKIDDAIKKLEDVNNDYRIDIPLNFWFNNSLPSIDLQYHYVPINIELNNYRSYVDFSFDPNLIDEARNNN